MDRNVPILHSLRADDTRCVRWCSIWLTSRRLMLRELFLLLLAQEQSLRGSHSARILESKLMLGVVYLLERFRSYMKSVRRTRYVPILAPSALYVSSIHSILRRLAVSRFTSHICSMGTWTTFTKLVLFLTWYR